MRVRFRREMDALNPEFDVKAHALARKNQVPYRIPRTIRLPAGTETDRDWDCKMMLRQGIADPLDDEARAYAANWPEDVLREREAAYDRLEKGMATGDSFYDAEPEQEDETQYVELPDISDDTPLRELGD